MNKFIFIFLSVLVFSANGSYKFDKKEIEININDKKVNYQLISGWSDITETPHKKCVFIKDKNASLLFNLSQKDTYLMQIVFFSEKKVSKEFIKIFLNNNNLIASDLKKKNTKYNLTVLLHYNIVNAGKNIIEISLNKTEKASEKIMFQSFKIQNYNGYNSHFPKLFIIYDDSKYLKEFDLYNISIILPILFYSIFLYIFINLIKGPSYVFVPSILFLLGIVMGSIFTQYHILLYPSSQIGLTILLVGIPKLIDKIKLFLSYINKSTDKIKTLIEYSKKIAISFFKFLSYLSPSQYILFRTPILDYLINIFFWSVFLPAFNGFILSIFNLKIVLLHLIVLSGFELILFIFFTMNKQLKHILKINQIRNIFSNWVLSDFIFTISIIGLVLIFDPGIIKFFKSQNLLGYSDVPWYFRIVNIAIEQNKFDVTRGGYQGLISSVYILNKIFGFSTAQSLNITIGSFIMFTILVFYQIVKTAYNENSIIGILGLFIVLSFPLTPTNYTATGFYVMLCAYFFIFNSIYQYYLIVKNGKNLKNLFYFNGSIFMAIITHPGVGILNVFSLLLVIIYTNLIIKKRLGLLFYILFIISNILPLLKYKKGYEIMFGVFRGVTNAKIPQIIFYIISVKAILSISAIIIIIILIFYLRKISERNSKKFGLLFYGIFLVWISSPLILNYSNIAVDWSRRTEYFKLFGLTLIILLPLKILEDTVNIKIKLLSYYKKVNLQHLIMAVLALITLPRMIYLNPTRDNVSIVTNESELKVSNWIYKNIPKGKILFLCYDESILPQRLSLYLKTLGDSLFTDAVDTEELGRTKKHIVLFVDSQLSPKTEKEVRDFLPLNKYVVDLYKNKVYDFLNVSIGYYRTTLDIKKDYFDYILIIGDIPKNVKNYLFNNTYPIYDEKEIKIYKAPEKSKIFNQRNTAIKNILNTEKINWNANCAFIKTFIKDEEICIEMKTENSEGKIECEINKEKYKDKILSVWMLVKRIKNCSAVLSIDDGINDTKSRSASVGLGTYEFLSVTKKIDIHPKYIKLKISIGSIDGLIEFQNLTCIER